MASSKIVFSKAKDGNETCEYFDGEKSIHLHSSSSPIEESRRFAENTSADFNPKLIILIEPALSYCEAFFRKKFPAVPICAIRFSKDFSKYDAEFDFVFFEGLEHNAGDSCAPSVSSISSYFSDQQIVSSLIIPWPSSAKAFPLQTESCLEKIKNEIIRSRDILVTRSYFSKRWALNIIKNARFLNKANVQEIKSLKKDFPVAICASGPSLKDSINCLKKNRDKYFLICVSSCLSTLLYNNIFPDICMTSDGGYYAKKHICFPLQKKMSKEKSIPIAFASEGAMNAKLLRNSKIIPLSYNDNPEKEIFDAFGVKGIEAKRNGTISGTALEFAYSLTDGNIFLFGLDLANSDTFQHTQPNQLEIENSTKDFRLSSKENRITRARFSSQESLKIYASWFSSLGAKKTGKTFRISNDFHFKNSLGNIRDKNLAFFEKCLEENESGGKTIEKISDKIKIAKACGNIQQNSAKNQSIREKISRIIENNASSIFPMDFLAVERCIDEKSAEEAKKRLDGKISSLVEKAKWILQ